MIEGPGSEVEVTVPDAPLQPHDTVIVQAGADAYVGRRAELLQPIDRTGEWLVAVDGFVTVRRYPARFLKRPTT